MTFSDSRRIRSNKLSITAVATCTATGLLLLVGGCPTAPQADGTIPLLDSDLSTGRPLADAADNGSFDSATVVPFDADDTAGFTATIDNRSDTDLFDLGVLAAGDRLVIDVQAITDGLDPVAAVFDESEALHAFNDDRTDDASDLNPLIDIIVRGPEQHYYLGIISFPESVITGEYSVGVSITRSVGLPEQQTQIVFLDWDGGTRVIVQNVGVFDLTPFNATDVGPYEGQTELLKDLVQQKVIESYDGFDIAILNSDDNREPIAEHSTVYFGGENLSAFAISEKIDTHNFDRGDSSIIFSSSFRDAFSITPNLDTMATAIANTVAHEIGHLLGLVHTADCESLMDTTCGNNSLLFDQWFKRAPLDDSVFPVGYQDAAQLLEWTIGLAGL